MAPTDFLTRDSPACPHCGLPLLMGSPENPEVLYCPECGLEAEDI